MTFVMVFLVNMLNSISFYMTNPIFPDYLVNRGILFELTGLISSAVSWTSMVCTPFAGIASDRFNKKMLLLLSHGLTTLCMFLYVAASGFPAILAVRILHGMAFAMTSTLNLTFATEFVPLDQISEGIADLTLGMLVGSMFGPQIGSMIADSFNISMTFLSSGLMSLFTVVLILLLPYRKKEAPSAPQKFSWKGLFAKEVLVYMVLIGIFSFGNGIISYYLRGLGSERGIANISVFFTVNSLALFIAKPFVSKWHDRHGIASILYPAFLINTVAMLMIGNARTLWTILAAAVLKAVSQGCGSAAIQAESVKLVGIARSGVGVSTCLIGQNIGNSVGPMVGAYLIARQGYATTFFWSAVLLVIGFIIFYFYDRRRKTCENDL